MRRRMPRPTPRPTPRLTAGAPLFALLVAMSACSDGPTPPPGGLADSVQPPRAVVTPAITRGPYVLNGVYYGRNRYVEYRAGNLPLLIRAPHGGPLEPTELPTRTCGMVGTGNDSNTENFARQLVDSLRVYVGAGRAPHRLYNRLHKRKLEQNRDTTEAVCLGRDGVDDNRDGVVSAAEVRRGDSLALVSWRDEKAFLDTAVAAMARQWGKGLVVDVHSHGHTRQLLEIGVGLPATVLARADAALDGTVSGYGAPRDSLFLGALARASGRPLSRWLRRDSTALGNLFAAEGVAAIPSRAYPGDTLPYWDARESFALRRYNCSAAGGARGAAVCGVLLEFPGRTVLSTEADRARTAGRAARVILRFLRATGYGDFAPAVR